MKKEEFFIGWSEKVPHKSRKSIRRFIIPLFLLVFTILWVIVFFTKPFTDGKFELGNVRKLTGVYYEEPIPILILDEGQLPEKVNPHALLVGYGKHGAKTFMKPIEKIKGSLSGKRIQIQGTLIYGEGKTLIELTKKEESVLAVLSKVAKKANKTQVQTRKLKGEILDPKCWFGVMKPAEGKVHKSCAIRCVSGGIPPVLRVNENDSNTYYVLKGEAGQDINQKILPFMAEPIAIEGKFYIENGWNVLHINPDQITLTP